MSRFTSETVFDRALTKSYRFLVISYSNYSVLIEREGRTGRISPEVFLVRNERSEVSDCYSSWLNVSAGVPQGTRLGPWLFLVMINDLKLPGGSFSMWKFADDTTVSEVVPSSGESSLQEAVNHISSWSHSNHFQLNPTKCKELIVSFQKIPPPYSPITIDGVQFQRVSSAKVLGVTISNDPKWNDHVDIITSKAARRLYLLSQLKRAGISSDDLLAFYYSAIRSVLEFSCQLFHRSLPKYLSDDIERIQRRAMRIIFPNLSYCEALNKAGIPTLSERRESLSIKLFEDIVSNEHHKLAKAGVALTLLVFTLDIKSVIACLRQVRPFCRKQT